MTTSITVVNKTARINVYIEPELKEEAERLAKKQRRTVSAMICLLLEEAIAKDKQEETE